MIVGIVGEYMHIIDIPEREITPVFQGKGFASMCELTTSFRIYPVLTGSNTPTSKFGGAKMLGGR